MSRWFGLEDAWVVANELLRMKHAEMRESGVQCNTITYNTKI